MTSHSLFKKKINNAQGFGLLGVVLVIFFLALSTTAIVTTIIPSASTRQNKDTVDQAQKIRVALTAFALNHAGTYPGSLRELVDTDGIPCALDNDPLSDTYLTLQGWCGPYLDRPVAENSEQYRRDGWGVFFDTSGAGDIISCGPNRLCGDGDDLTFSP